MYLCKQIQSMERLDGAFLFHTNCADIKVCFVTDEIVRVRVAFDRELAEESYILSTTAWEDRLDGLFAAERTRVQPVTPDVTVTDAAITFETAAVRLVAERYPLCFKLYDKEGTLLHSDLAGAPYILDSNRRVTHYSAMAEEDCFYGFGEKTGLLNKNKRFLRERATDAMGYDAEKMDTLYKHIPFYIQLSRATRKAVGVFYNNFYESVFNMGCEKSNYWSRYSYWQADGGDIDLFLIAGGSIRRVVDNYTLLTGRPALLPLARQYLLISAAFYFPLSLVNIVRFLIQGMGFSPLATLAGVLEMAARGFVSYLVPVFGFAAACYASPAAWVLADLFLVPAYFYCRRKLARPEGARRTLEYAIRRGVSFVDIRPEA